MCNKCKYCKKEFKSVTKRQDGSDSIRTVCGSCSVSKRRWKSKIEITKSFGGKCSVCGFTGHPGSFQFHHTSIEDKEFNISGNGLLKKDRINELKKCSLVCANCHCALHSNNELLKKFGYWKDEWIKKYDEVSVPVFPNLFNRERKIFNCVVCSKETFNKKYCSDNCWKIKNFEKEKQNIEKVKNSNIDFSKNGWVLEVSKLIGKQRQKIKKWMKRYVPDIYDQKCFKRSSGST